ncbi:hypothetical protein SADO_03810 [Salinisphaera dokdonensis CL-ES53]|uniref:Lipoprotein n=1 Tax=Salinisphaera dokdonensis CL-ES53 TaxID=1304272 RepID=A0ABV2AXH9_9GAMM
MRAPILAIASLLTLAACTAAPDSVTDGSEQPADTPAAQIIPETIQGRWGLVPADCEPGRGDAKGLLVIGPTQLRFYESTGTLGRIAERDASRIRAEFAFRGEGMTWRRDEVLDAQEDGQTLIRREYGEGAAPGPFEYRRCPA